MEFALKFVKSPIMAWFTYAYLYQLALTSQIEFNKLFRMCKQWCNFTYLLIFKI